MVDWDSRAQQSRNKEAQLFASALELMLIMTSYKVLRKQCKHLSENMLEIGLQRSNICYSCLTHSPSLSVQCGPSSLLCMNSRVPVLVPGTSVPGWVAAVVHVACLQLESDVRFQFETLKPRALKVG